MPPSTPGAPRALAAPALDADALAAHAAAFGAWEGYGGAEFERFTLESLHVTMDDGVLLAVDVVLPEPRAAGQRLPAVLVVTRYWRGREGHPPGETARFFAAHGYAVVTADERGTGASFGTWDSPWSARAVGDYGALAAWCARQPWSDGTVAGVGTSYLGTTAQLLARPTNPAVRAVVPKFMERDAFTDIVAPGGIPLTGFLAAWSRLVDGLDRGRWPGRGPGVRPVDGPRGPALRTQAIAAHRSAFEVLGTLGEAHFRDRPAGPAGIVVDDFSVHTRKAEIEASGVPIQGWGSWLDAATADAVLVRFLTFSNPQHAVIGAWSHGGGHDTDPFRPTGTPADPPPPAQLLEQLRFLEEHLRGIQTGARRGVTYSTLGSNGWRTTDRWPPDGIESRRWFLRGGGGLSLQAPERGEGADRHRVDFTATTGPRNRWATELDGGDVVYPDRRAADARLLTYTSEPLATALEITGHPAATLRVRSTHGDGAFFVYLEAVAPDGRVVLLTEGQIRAVHRTLRTDLPAALGPRPTFRAGDARLLVPGELTTIAFALLPTSARIPAGWRLRVAVAGHDAGTFARLPAPATPEITPEITPVITVEHHAEALSFLDLPSRPLPSRPAR